MFNEKKIRVEITKYSTSIAGINLLTNFGSGEKYVFDGMKVNCRIQKVPATCGYTASIDIYGVNQQELSSITNIAWIQGKIVPMSVRIYADDGKGYITVFEGGVMEAVPNYKNVPDVSIHIESSMMVYPNQEKVPPISLEQGTIISDACRKLCSVYGYGCVVSPEVNLMFWKGGTKKITQRSFGECVRELCRITGLEYAMKNNSVVFYEKGIGTRTTYTFGPNDYVGYPTFEQFGISIQLDDVTSSINCGDVFKISGSVVPNADGYWVVNKIEYKLETWKKNGAWNMIVHGTRTVLNG